MMMNENYEKPKMKFVNVRNDKSVANTCWGGHGKGMTWHYNTSGSGYASFQIMGGNCSLDGLTVTYHHGNTSIPAPSGTKTYNEVYAALVNADGNQGTPFKNESWFPPTPNPGWS